MNRVRYYRRRSMLGAFGYGLVVAASGAGLAIGAFLVLAPPGGETDEPSEVRNVLDAASSTYQRWARAFGVGGSEQPGKHEQAGKETVAEVVASPSPSQVRVAAPLSTEAETRKQQLASAEANRALVRNIQAELKRVGCHAGSASGSWDASTQIAMTAFAEVANVHVDVGAPDYGHLTLLQGHDARACARACSTDSGVKGCLPRAVVAKRPGQDGASVTAPGETRSRSQEVAVPAVPPPARVVAAPPPSLTAVPPPPVLVREGQWRASSGSAPPVAQPPPQPAQPQVVAAPPVQPLPGRFSLGGPGTEPAPAQDAAPSVPVALTPVPGAAPAAVAPAARPTVQREREPRREARPAREPRPAGGDEGARRSREIFSRLNRDSP